jgi:hypothetical protein
MSNFNTNVNPSNVNPSNYLLENPMEITPFNLHSFAILLGKKINGTSHYWIGELKETDGKFKKVKSCTGRAPGYICEACLRGMPSRLEKTQSTNLIIWFSECIKHAPYENNSPIYTEEYQLSMIKTGKFITPQARRLHD